VLSYLRDGRAAVWTLSRPPVNAIDVEWVSDLHQALDEIADKSGVSVLLVRSDLKVFCGGANLNLIRNSFASAEGADAMIVSIRGIQDLYTRIEQLPQATVAEINGAAMGGGLELALSCDLRIAAREAKMGLPEAGLGLLPGAGGTQRLTRLCGPGVARRLILGGEAVDGVTAEALGIVQWAVPRDELAAHAEELVGRLSTIPAQALAECKRCMLDHFDPDRDGYETELDGTRRLLDNPETRSRVASFLDKAGR
jgi:enoyl-CoA hydratase/carnithine racemase